ncbi:glucosylceramidase [Terrimonas sp.]|uniref:glycoside hydrolase family 30 protein n=1 Tax=Terrimonas sp. TaxID=1914338 RepID=UPI000D512068|nr:glycoside hydrolase family 30 beta sandwich domain-containing protein [Terrimonas sp.]PVD50115.1 glucosylceramidase [Terrimonas sp.]
MTSIKKRITRYALLLMTVIVIILLSCKQKETEHTPPVVNPPAVNEVDFWLTKSDETVKLQKQTGILAFGTPVNQYPVIEVNEGTTYQTIDGFGYTLTGGSADVINSLNTAKKQELLQELFGSGENAIAVSYLRLSIGASDLNAVPFTYNDIAEGQTDINLEHFTLAKDTVNLLPLLKEILAINPAIKIIATPWSPPVWMKDNNSFVGGSLQPQYYAVYALYFVKYIQAMKAEGITIDAITPQNEPLHPGNNPSLLMTADQQADFIKNHLGPTFQKAGINTKIVIYDHNCDKPDYPISILNDAATKQYINGSAFHLYAGDISALSTVRNAHPDKALYFTEQYTASAGGFGGDLNWHVKNVIIGSMRNWSRNALEWNLANDASFGPHTDGGCTTCKGAITIETGSTYTKNVAFYIIAHASKFVPANSTRIESTIPGGLNNVAFKTPGGKKVLIVQNDGANAIVFNIKYNGKWVVASLDKGAIGTFVW